MCCGAASILLSRRSAGFRWPDGVNVTGRVRLREEDFIPKPGAVEGITLTGTTAARTETSMRTAAVLLAVTLFCILRVPADSPAEAGPDPAGQIEKLKKLG